MKIKDLTGQIFGRLTVIGPTIRKGYWSCKCECGTIKDIQRSGLISNRTKSCGCILAEYQKNKKRKHGMTQDSFYRKWIDMKGRCFKKNHKSYSDYGGRGISISKEWLEFINFKNDMYESYLEHLKENNSRNVQIDRINNDGDYCKNNCKWSTMKEQRINQRPSICQKFFKAISPDGKIFISNNQQEFSRNNGLTPSIVNRCVNGKLKKTKGWIFVPMEDF